MSWITLGLTALGIVVFVVVIAVAVSNDNTPTNSPTTGRRDERERPGPRRVVEPEPVLF